MAYCGKCGTQLSDGAKFCPKCGASVAPETNDDKTPSSKKIVISLVVSIIALICIGGGFYIYQQNKKEEIRKKEELRIKAEAKKADEERKRIEKKREEEERERRRIEEENKPNNILYNLAKNNKDIVWSYSYNTNKKGCGEKELKICPTIFLYPESPSAGRMSYVIFDFSEFYSGGRASSVRTKYIGPYTITDNVIHASLNYYMAIEYRDIGNMGFRIDKIGNSIQLVEIDGMQNQVFKQTTKLRDDPMK